MAAPDTPNTFLARLARRNRRASGDLGAARKRLYRALEMAEACMMDAAAEGDRAGVLKAVHATTQAAAAFARLVEVGELEARLNELEQALEARNAKPTAGTYGGAHA